MTLLNLYNQLIAYNIMNFYIYIIYMTTKCYIVDFDRRINNYKKLLDSTKNSIYNQYVLPYDYDIDSKVKNYTNTRNHEYSNDTNLKLYLESINKYLDEILNMPDISDEEIHNINNDQKEILNMMDNITSDLRNIENKSQNCVKENEPDKRKQPINNNDIPSNITININSGEKKNTFMPTRKFDPKKVIY